MKRRADAEVATAVQAVLEEPAVVLVSRVQVDGELLGHVLPLVLPATPPQQCACRCQQLVCLFNVNSMPVGVNSQCAF